MDLKDSNLSGTVTTHLFAIHINLNSAPPKLFLLNTEDVVRRLNQNEVESETKPSG